MDFELVTFGNSLTDAMYKAVDAAAGRILSMLKDGEKIPQPSNIKKIKPDDSSGFVSMVYIDLDNLKENYDENPHDSFMA